MARTEEETTVIHPEVFTLHWEGPEGASAPAETAFPNFEELEVALAAERERELHEIQQTEQGAALWTQIQQEAAKRGDEQLWNRKLHAYSWVKLNARGNAGDYARRYSINHATVRTWISDVAKLAYEVGYRLHEDKLLLVGAAPGGLRRLREIVNEDAASDEAWVALKLAEAEYRGEDPYFHLNEGHVLRARGDLRGSNATLKEGLAIAEARSVRSLLWNARGQTLWDCGPESNSPIPDHLGRAERCFRRAAMLDQSTYFPFVNLAQMAVDARDFKRTEYWIGELSAARKRMTQEMKDALAKYLDQAEWIRAVEPKRFWTNGPGRWIGQAASRGVLALLALALVVGIGVRSASADPPPVDGVDRVYGGGESSGAGGN